jgi:DNA excision repair protein ERCC-4
VSWSPDLTPPQINNICSKMALLALAFPSLSILWSRSDTDRLLTFTSPPPPVRSPHDTIDIFRSLKKNFDSPDVARCLAIGNDDPSSTGGTSAESSCVDDLTPQDLLLSLPGINTNNFRAVMNTVTDIAELSQMTVQQLTPLIGPINARKLCRFFKQTL